MRAFVLFPSMCMAFDDAMSLLQVSAKPEVLDTGVQWPDTANGCNGANFWNGPFENQKCKYQHADRLWRIERISLDDCKARCVNSDACHAFSYSSNFGGKSVCMGCKDEGQPAPDGHVGFQFWRECDETTTTTVYTTTKAPTYDCGVPQSVEQVTYCCKTFPGRFPASTCDPLLNGPSAEDDPHITSITGNKFDVYKPGEHEFFVFPKGATPQNADLYISGKVQQFGERENDLWIRKLKVEGSWVQNGPYEFKTSDVPFGKKKSALIRQGASKNWKALDNTNLDSNLLVVSAVDQEAPEADFAQSISKKLELQAGPVKVLIDYATSQKNGEDVNHLDLRLKGLQSSDMNSMGGLLAGNMNALQLPK